MVNVWIAVKSERCSPIRWGFITIGSPLPGAPDLPSTPDKDGYYP